MESKKTETLTKVDYVIKNIKIVSMNVRKSNAAKLYIESGRLIRRIVFAAYAGFLAVFLHRKYYNVLFLPNFAKQMQGKVFINLYLVNSETHKSFVFYYFSGPSDGQLICGGAPRAYHWEDMGQSNKVQAEDPSSKDANQPPESNHTGLGKLYVPLQNFKKRSSCCRSCLKVLFVFMAVINILKSIIVIAVSVSTAIALKIYSNDVSGRLVAMIILAVTAAVTLSISIYALVAVVTNKKKCLYATTVVLVILAVIQAVIVGVAVKVTPEDEMNLGRSLADSFRLARDDNPRHVKIWATTQNDLNCCGVYSPEDYRSPKIPKYFSPDVPISCCPSYDPDRSELVQEREREVCKAKKQYYNVGCRSLVLEVFKDSATIVMGVTISLIVLEVILAIVGSILCRERNNKKSAEEGTDDGKSSKK